MQKFRQRPVIRQMATKHLHTGLHPLLMLTLIFIFIITLTYYAFGRLSNTFKCTDSCYLLFACTADVPKRCKTEPLSPHIFILSTSEMLKYIF